MNCPELVKEFEENYKKKGGKTEVKAKKTSRTKKAKMDKSVEENQSDEEPSLNTTDVNETTEIEDGAELNTTNGSSVPEDQPATESTEAKSPRK